jgi:hypothetical protein
LLVLKLLKRKSFQVWANSLPTSGSTYYFAVGTSGAFPTSTSYRSKQSGNWNTLSTWESSTDGSAWDNASSIPSSSDGTITILNGHNITVTAAVTIDQTTINAGGTITVKNTTTKKNIPVTSAQVVKPAKQGTLNDFFRDKSFIEDQRLAKEIIKGKRSKK